MEPISTNSYVTATQLLPLSASSSRWINTHGWQRLPPWAGRALVNGAAERLRPPASIPDASTTIPLVLYCCHELVAPPRRHDVPLDLLAIAVEKSAGPTDELLEAALKILF